jgi:hypothetical protein
VDRVGAGRAELQPEVRAFPITKPPEIGVAIFAFEGQEEFDFERRKCRLIENQLFFHVGDAQYDVVDHGIFPFSLGSGLVDQSQKMTVAARAMADKKTVGHLS